MIRKVLFGAILVLYSVQSSFALPLAQQDEPRPNPNPMEPLPMPMSIEEARQFPNPMLPLPTQLPTENRQEQPMMPMSVPMPNQFRQEQPMMPMSIEETRQFPNPMLPLSTLLPSEMRQEQPMPDGSMQLPMMKQQDQNEPMPMHNDPMMMIALRNPEHARESNEPMRGSPHRLLRKEQHHNENHNEDHMHHAYMPHNREHQKMMEPKDEHKPERTWSREHNHPLNNHKHDLQMDKHPLDQMHKPSVDPMHKPSAEQLHKQAVELNHPSKARSQEDAIANHLIGMHQARQAYQSQQYRPSPCSRVVVGCSPHVQEVPCSYGSAPAPYHPAPYHAPPAPYHASYAAPAYHAPQPSYYAPAPSPQYHAAPSYSDVHQRPGPPYADALLGTTRVHSMPEKHQPLHQHEPMKHHQHEIMNQHQPKVLHAHEQHDHKMTEAHHKDSHPESTNVKTHESEKQTEKPTERESNKVTTTTPVAPCNDAVSELKKKIHDHTVAMAQFREATEEKLKESVMKSPEVHDHKGHEHKHQQDSCVQACNQKILQSQQMLQKNLLE